MPELAGRTPASQLAPLVTLVLALSPPAALAAEPDDASRGYPDNPVSDYVDRSSDGLTPVDPPGTSAPSLTSVEVETPSAAPPGAPKPAEWMLVPIPGYNPTLGFMLTGMGAYIFPADAKSPPSTVGGFGMFSTNGSWALGGIAKLNLAEDHFRVLGFLFLGHINWDFYGIGNEAADRGQFVPLSQGMAGGRLESLFRIAQGLYLGPRWTLMKMRSTADLSQVQVPPELVPPSNELVSWFSAPGAKLQWDTRDSQFFPRRGQLMELSFDVHLKALGDSFDYVAGKLAWNQYLGLTPRQVLAFREVVSLASTNTPFYALPGSARDPTSGASRPASTRTTSCSPRRWSTGCRSSPGSERWRSSASARSSPIWEASTSRTFCLRVESAPASRSRRRTTSMPARTSRSASRA